MYKLTFAILFSVVIAASCGDPAVDTRALKEDSLVKTTENVSENPDNVTSKAPKCFYWNYDVPTGVEEAVEMTEEEAKKIVRELPETDGNFFGLELADGSVVQFMYDGQNKTWFLDIPNPVTQESFNVDLAMEDVLNIIVDVYAGKSAEDIRTGYTP